MMKVTLTRSVGWYRWPKFWRTSWGGAVYWRDRIIVIQWRPTWLR